MRSGFYRVYTEHTDGIKRFITLEVDPVRKRIVKGNTFKTDFSQYLKIPFRTAFSADSEAVFDPVAFSEGIIR